jgi:membrane protein implicated in regulation of membrane protease activity
MTTPRTDPPARGGDALLGLLAFAVIIGSAAIAGVCVLGSWWLLPLGLLAVIGLAIVVAYALVHLMSENDLRAPQLPAREPVARPEPSTAPVRALPSH